MTKASQAIVATLLGAMLLGLAGSEKYLDFVRPWTRIPLLLCGLLLFASSVMGALRRKSADGEQPSPLAWLLLVPVFVVFIARPPELGAYIAEHQANELPPKTAVHHPTALTGAPTPIGIFQFVETAAYDPTGYLSGLRVKMVGFVSYDSKGNWYITRLSITCCAADAQSSRVLVVGASKPPRNTWIKLIGTWVDTHTKVPRKGAAKVKATDVQRIAKPKNPYEY